VLARYRIRSQVEQRPPINIANELTSPVLKM
jgi:hypothetical protein